MILIATGLLCVIITVLVHYVLQRNKELLINIELPKQSRFVCYKSGFHRITEIVDGQAFISGGVITDNPNFTIFVLPDERNSSEMLLVNLKTNNISESVSIPLTKFEYPNEAVVANNSGHLPGHPFADIYIFAGISLLAVLIGLYNKYCRNYGK